jgi:hypothetical protein
VILEDDTNTQEEVAPEMTNKENKTVIDTIEKPFTPTESKGNTKGKRGPRPAINVGDIVVTPSSRTNFATRATRMDSNPVYLAVQNADLDTPYDLHVDEDKVAGVISILRRSGARLGIGVHIASGPHPASDQRDGAVVLTFKTGERQERKAKTEAVVGGEGGSTE